MARPTPSQRRDSLWTLPLDVRWGDADMLGHINNATYFTYSESARIAFFAEVFGPTINNFDGDGPILADIGCSFHRQVRFPAALDIGVQIVRIGSSSLEIHSPMFLRGEDTAVADVRSVLVWFDYRAQKPAPVPSILQRYLVTAESNAG
ncbi:MAG: thioesterase family protein [Oceanococcaceae bacterium]